MPARRFQPNWRARILYTVGMVAAWLVVARLPLTDPVSVTSLLALAVALLNTSFAIRPWRGYVAADDEGITVHPGIGRVHHVEWTQVRSIRVPARGRAPALERYEGPEISLHGLLAHSELDELAGRIPSWAERSGGRPQ